MYSLADMKSFERPVPQVVDLTSLFAFPPGSAYSPSLKCGAQAVYLHAGVVQTNILVLDPLTLDVMASFNAGTQPLAFFEELNDVLYCNSSTTLLMAYNMARANKTINNATCYGRNSLSARGITLAGVGVGAPPVPPSNNYRSVMRRFKSPLLPPKAAADNTGTITTPDAPSVTPAASGGGMADATYEVKIAWMTRRNTLKTGYGATLPSAAATAAVSGGAGAGSVAVTIPALPTGALAALIYVGVQGQTLYLAGSKRSAGTFTLRHNPVSLNLDKKMFFQGNGYAHYVGDFSGIATGAPVWTNAGLSSLNYFAPMVSPFFKDAWKLYLPYYASTSELALDVGYVDLRTNAATANTTAVDEEAPFFPVQAQASHGFEIPELGGFLYYAAQLPNATGGSNMAGPPIIYSCVDNEPLWVGDQHTVGYVASNLLHRGPVDYQVIDGIVFLVTFDQINGKLYRTPVILQDR